MNDQWYVRVHHLPSAEPVQSYRVQGRESGPFDTKRAAEAFAVAVAAKGGVAEASIYARPAPTEE